jgi:hypothetical protein
MRRVFVVSLVLAISLLILGCGGSTAGSTTTSSPAAVTTAPPTTTTTSATTTTSQATTTTTAAPATTTSGAATALTPELKAYALQLVAWGTALQQIPQADGFSITDISKVTAAQLKAAEAYATALHGALDQLKAIKAPAEAAVVHESLTTAFSGLVDATDNGVKALKNKDQAALDAANAQAANLVSQITQLMQSWQSSVTGGTPAS